MRITISQGKQERNQSFCSSSSTDTLTRARFPAAAQHDEVTVSVHTHLAPTRPHFEKGWRVPDQGPMHSAGRPGSQGVGPAPGSQGELYFPHLRRAGPQHKPAGAVGLPGDLQAPPCVSVDDSSSLLEIPEYVPFTLSRLGTRL